MSWEELKDSLISSFPPGTEKLWDWQDAPGNDVEAMARTIEDTVVDPVEVLGVEVNPSTCVLNQARWERCLGITNPAATVAARRAVLISRFRELGRTVTRPMVQAVIAPLLDVADASQVVVVESDRQQLRYSHTYQWAGYLAFTSTPVALPIHVADDARVSQAGARLDLLLTCADLGAVAVTLTAPDSRSITRAAGTIGRGALPDSSGDSTVRVYFPEFAGAAAGGVFGGNWSVTLATSGSDTVSSAALFVEGIGKSGLGASVFYWGVMAEEAKLGPAADLVAARAALQRIRYACRPASLLRRSSGTGALPEGDYAAIPGDPGAIAGAALPGSV